MLQVSPLLCRSVVLSVSCFAVAAEYEWWNVSVSFRQQESGWWKQSHQILQREHIMHTPEYAHRANDFSSRVLLVTHVKDLGFYSPTLNTFYHLYFTFNSLCTHNVLLMWELPSLSFPPLYPLPASITKAFKTQHIITKEQLGAVIVIWK